MTGYRADDGGDVGEAHRDAELLAELIASDELAPPLSLGIFGRRSAGKSFFLRLLQQAIVAIHLRQGGHGVVVQVHFNALLYAETNPWIALVDGMYRALEDGLGFRGLDSFEGLGGTAARLRAAAEARTAAARAVRDRAHEDHAHARAQYEAALQELAEIASWQRWAHIEQHEWNDLGDPTRSSIERAGTAIGMTGLAARPEDLHNLLQQTKSIEGIASVISASLLAARWLSTLTTGLVGIVGTLLFLVVAWLLFGQNVEPGAYYDTLGKLLGLASTLLAAVGALAVVMLRNRARSALVELRGQRDRLRDAERNADRHYHLTRAVVDDRVASARDAVTRSLAAVQAADRDLARIASESEAFLRPGILRRVIEFYRDSLRAGGGGEASIVPVLREDIEALTHWLLDGRGAAHGLRRIVVYIDDLDRCPPERQFALLQATNLLLSTPLFVCALALDPIATSAALFSSYRTRGAETLDLADVERSAAGYLDHVIQIPFWMSTASPQAIEALIRNLVRTEAMPAEEGPDAAPPSASALPEHPLAPAVPAAEPAYRIEWRFSDQEIALATALMVAADGTPRMAKRFVNLCRLALALERPRMRFEEFAAVATLLAVIVAFPEHARAVFLLLSQLPPAALNDVLAGGLSGTDSPQASLVEAISARERSALRKVLGVYLQRDGDPETLRAVRATAARFSYNLDPENLPGAEVG